MPDGRARMNRVLGPPSTDTPMTWEQLAQTQTPVGVIWEAFHAAMAVFGDESEQAATIFRIHREAEEHTR